MGEYINTDEYKQEECNCLRCVVHEFKGASMNKSESKAIIEVVVFTVLFTGACLVTMFGFLGVIKFLFGAKIG